MLITLSPFQLFPLNGLTAVMLCALRLPIDLLIYCELPKCVWIVLHPSVLDLDYLLFTFVVFCKFFKPYQSVTWHEGRGVVEVWLYPFMTVALDGVDCHCQALTPSLPRKDLVPIVQEAWVGPKACLGGCGKSCSSGLEL